MTDSRRLLVLCEDLLGRGVPVRFRAVGHSMAPAIRDGERIEVAPLCGRGIRRGDVVLYRGTAGVVAHRVVGVAKDDEEAIRIRGDSSAERGELVARNRILGRVVSVERAGRRVRIPKMGTVVISCITRVLRRFAVSGSL